MSTKPVGAIFFEGCVGARVRIAVGATGTNLRLVAYISKQHRGQATKLGRKFA
jgi:hypothetical protein